MTAALLAGIDIAGYQNTTYSTTGLDFVVVKATEGVGYKNPKHAAQVATARAHGLVVGHYHFARPGSMKDQWAYFLAYADPADGDFLAFDWEDTGVSGADKDTWLRIAKAKAPDHRTILYANRDFWINRDTTSYCADGLWIADPSAPKGEPRVKHPWLFHQYNETGGIDHNVGNFPSREALKAWATGQPAPEQETTMTPDEKKELATMVADTLMAPEYRDKLATTVLWWLAAGLDPKLPLPTDPTAAAWVNRFRTALTKTPVGTDTAKRLDAIQAALTNPSGLVTNLENALEGINIKLTVGGN